MSGPSEGEYRVSCSGLEMKRLGQLLARADLLDTKRRRQVRRALKHVFHKLRTEPLTWGEQEQSLPHSGLPIYHALHSILNVYYTVVKEQHSVVIQTIRCNIPLPQEDGPDETA